MDELVRLRATYEEMRSRYNLLVRLQRIIQGQVEMMPDGSVRVNAEDLDAMLLNRAIMLSLMEAQEQKTGPPPVSEADLLRLRCRALATSAGDCAICLDGMTTGTVVCTLPCDHEFCKVCAHRWLKEHRTCPICRNEVVFSTPPAVDPRPPSSPVGAAPAPPRLRMAAASASTVFERREAMPASEAIVPARIPEELRRLPTPVARLRAAAVSAAEVAPRFDSIVSNGETIALTEPAPPSGGGDRPTVPRGDPGLRSHRPSRQPTEVEEENPLPAFLHREQQQPRNPSPPATPVRVAARPSERENVLPPRPAADAPLRLLETTEARRRLRASLNGSGQERDDTAVSAGGTEPASSPATRQWPSHGRRSSSLNVQRAAPRPAARPTHSGAGGQEPSSLSTTANSGDAARVTNFAQRRALPTASMRTGSVSRSRNTHGSQNQ